MRFSASYDTVFPSLLDADGNVLVVKAGETVDLPDPDESALPEPLASLVAPEPEPAPEPVAEPTPTEE